MARKDKASGRVDSDTLNTEILRDEVSRIFKDHPDNYIEKLEELGFTYYDDETDEEEQEEATARPVNANQEYLDAFFDGKIPLSDQTVEIFLKERRNPDPNLPLFRKRFKYANKHLLALLLRGLHLYPVDECIAIGSGFFP